MGLLKWIARKLGGFGRKLAVRSRWLAKRLWVVMLADVLWTTRKHWVRLEPRGALAAAGAGEEVTGPAGQEPEQARAA